MPTRVRIRGPSGQSTASLDDHATVGSLRKQISDLTSLTSFDLKMGYPPKPILLDQYDDTTLLSSLDLKLNGEQLLVTRAENIDTTQATTPTQTNQANTAETTQPHAESSRETRPSTSTKPLQSSAKPSKRAADAPLALQRKPRKEMSDPPEVFVPDLGGTLVLRVMPDDNSCLFRAISLAVLSDLDAVTELRSIVAEAIQNDPLTYNKAVLDNKEPNAYCKWIRSQDSWGGQIELLILSQHFDIEICSIDVQTLRVDRYNEAANKRCIVVYSGIHYDTIALSLPGEPPESDVKVFEDFIKEEVLPKGLELCRKLQEAHYFTDTSGFQLVCNDCGVRLTGERGAQEHAGATGHYNFGEAE